MLCCNLSLLAALVGFCSCASPRGNSSNLEQQRAAYHKQPELQFNNGMLLKPDPASSIDTTLAPLLILEVRTDALPGQASTEQPVVADSDTGHSWIVYWDSGEVHLNGRTHGQLMFFWSAPAAPVREAGPRVEGIRITLDSSGHPVIWEVLSDRSAPRQIFVAESLEKRSRAEHGEPLPGRRFSIERAVDHQPSVVVSRILEDGPVPMGPVVYLEQRQRTIATLLCRCMPAQVQQIIESSNYQLRSLKPLLKPSSESLSSSQQPTLAPWILELQTTPGDLDSLLRLPKIF